MTKDMINNGVNSDDKSRIIQEFRVSRLRLLIW